MSGEQAQFSMDTAGERLDRFLARQMPELTRSHIQKLIERGDVLVGVKAQSLDRQWFRPGHRRSPW